MKKKRAVINILTSLMVQVVAILYGLIVPKMIISSYGSSVNGLISSITQFLGYITLLEAGVGPVIKAVLYKPISKKNTEEIESILNASQNFFRKISYIFMIYIVLLCICLPNIMKNEFDAFFTVSLTIIVSISTFAEYFFGMTYRLYLESEQKVYVISIIQIITYVLNMIIIVCLIKMGLNIQIVKLASAFIFVLRPILQSIYVKKKFHVKISKENKQYKIEQKWDGLAQHIAAVVHNNTDITILTLFSDIKQVSVYSVYLLILNGVKNLILAFTSGMDALFGNLIANDDNDGLRKNFNIYEIIYMSVSTLVFSVTLILIIPFVKIYTNGINDVNYVIPAFAYLMVIAEFIWSIRQPYNELVKAAGHFKQTKIGAWVEAITNIIISLLLVIKCGIIGVAIGTIVAMLIRTIEFICYTNKCILKRSIIHSAKKIVINVIETLIIVLIVPHIKLIEYNSYISWFVNALIVFICSFLIIIICDIAVYAEERKDIINKIKEKIKK